MAKISLQQIFNAGWQAFIVEGRRPSMSPGVSRYLSSEGDKCVVGLCLPDGPVQRHLYNFTSLVCVYPELFDAQIVALAKPDTALNGHTLDDFQARLHDDICHWNKKTNKAEWTCSLAERERMYRDVAEDFNLTIPEITDGFHS